MASGEQTPSPHMRTLQSANSQALGAMTSSPGVFYTPPRLNTQAGVGLPYNPPNSNNQNRGWPALRVILPEFDGTWDVDEWLMRINHYLSYYNTPEGDRIKVCSVQLKS